VFHERAEKVEHALAAVPRPFMLGPGYEFDHMIPLNRELVSGLPREPPDPDPRAE